MLETNDDNLRLLGDFWIKYRVFGISYLIIGFIIAIPYSFTLLSCFSVIFTNIAILENSLYYTSLMIIVIFVLLYIISNLTLISISFILIFFGGKPNYIKKEKQKEINQLHFFPNIFMLILIGFLLFLNIFGNSLYYFWFRDFFLII